MKVMNKFNVNEFKNPSKENNVVYFWMWNSPITKELIDRRLGEFYKAGINGFYIVPEPIDFRPERIRTFLFPQYLSEEYFELIKYTFDNAKEKGMEMWIYDEGGWPSGGACGHTARQNPEAIETLLCKKDITIKKGEQYVLSENKTFISTESVKSSFIAEKDTVVSEYYLEKVSDNNPNRVDSTNGGVIDTFINNTYEKYYECVGEMFGKNVSVFFTDEPSIRKGLIPKNLFEIFSKKYGYDLEEYLPVLLDKDLAQTERQEKARIDYGRLLGELFYQNFSKKLSCWCNKHNIKFGGHLDKDDVPDGGERCGYFSIVHALSGFDVPGIDVIWRQITYPINGENPTFESTAFFPRVASSAARQTGKKLALTETFGIYGDAISQDEMRYVANYQAIRGINVFNFCCVSSGEQRLGSLIKRPTFSANKPGFNNLRNINNYYARLSYLLRLGDLVCDTALYLPAADMWGNKQTHMSAYNSYNEVGVALESRNIYFDIIDDYGIESAEVTSAGLKLGKAIYKHIVVPKCKYMPRNIAERIAPFISEGASLPGSNNCSLITMRRNLENGTMWFIFNQGTQMVNEILNIKAQKLYKIDLQYGEIYGVENAEINLTCGEIAVFFDSDEDISCDKQDVEYSVEITDFKPVKAQKFEIDYYGISMKPISVADVEKTVFSGDVTFIANYELPKEVENTDKFHLKLLDTSLTANISINGKVIADFGLNPMKATVLGENIPKKGIMEVTVSNSAADEVAAKESLIKSFPAAEVGPYYDKIKEFEIQRPVLKLGRVIIEKVK